MVQSLEDVLGEQAKKLVELRMASNLILSTRSHSSIQEELAGVQEEVSSLKAELRLARGDLQVLNLQNGSLKKLSVLLESLNAKIIHMENNVPSDYLRNFGTLSGMTDISRMGVKKPSQESFTPHSVHTLSAIKQNDRYEEHHNCKMTLFNEPTTCYPELSLITQEEFNQLPKYMIGRQTLETLNNFLVTINSILKAKYSLLALGKNGAKKKGEFDLYMSFRSQESTDAKGKGKVYFFTAEDYHRQTKTKLDKTKLNLLTVLRHCKRLREVRAAKAIQYAVFESLNLQDNHN
ncbi:spindle and kinetochore-associated protein 1-like [Athalia rosae]|uniref:spindle and kinetochore-associated protein 1-like n=1 Tax=Athalia rosae TaxID=37344 RepID=UPI000626334E|nr:spindle and kinetochore-associated protein 1-like [Athalia rosae]